MSRVMFLQALRDLRWSAFWYTLGLALYGLLIMSFYPTVRENTGLLQQYLQTFPKAMTEAFGITDMTSLEGFIGGEYLNAMWPLIASIFVIMAGAATVAREVERGTIELLLSVPESRTRLLAGKLAALLVGMLALVAATLGSLALGARLVDETLGLTNLLALGAVLLFYTIAVGGYSVLLSSLFKERGKPAGLAAGLTLAFYLAWVISGLSEAWQWLRNVSIFTAYEPQTALASAEVQISHLAVLLGFGLFCSVAALFVFRRRDAAP